MLLNLCKINQASYNLQNIKESQNIWFVAIFIFHGLVMEKKTSPFNDKIILAKATINQLTSVYQAFNSSITWFSPPLSKSKFQAMGTHNPAVLLLIFLSLHLMALSIMWTVWDYSTWYEKASGRTFQKQLCWNESLACTRNHLPILSHFQFWPYYHILLLTFILLSFWMISFCDIITLKFIFQLVYP